jgi:hypothetical protein
MKILSGHNSPETAYVVSDYPYGFRLRCVIRYWLEFKKGRGTRLVSQTTNPKRPLTVWNKPKASTYAEFGGAMYLDENEHVQWQGLTQYSDLAACRSYLGTFGAGLSEPALAAATHFIKLKEVFDSEKQSETNPGGFHYSDAAIVASLHVSAGKTLEDARGLVRGSISARAAKAASKAAEPLFCAVVNVEPSNA